MLSTLWTGGEEPAPLAERPPTEWLMSVVSEHPVELGFRMPRDHLMRWIVPSLSFERVPGAFTLAAPRFLLEMDWNIIVSVEEPQIQLSPEEPLTNER